MEPDSDQQLVKSMLGGDERAFRIFFDAYFPRVYRFALPRLGGDVEAAKEVVQATLIKGIRKLETFRGQAALFSWLCQICRNEVVDFIRANKRHASHLVLVDDSPEMRAAFESIVAPPQHEPAHCYSDAETRRLVRSVLDGLPNRYGDVLEWKYIDGRSVDEIGTRLGITSIAAQSILARARIGFREALEAVFGSTAQDVLAGMLTEK
jgi:RNA polymerase sigma-70 factor (ECF subfamily)